ncbi:MAG: hypothetical protein LBF66_03610 [Holosporales bacterium]|nr:hypothetical protein [Holosporales bacterium]
MRANALKHQHLFPGASVGSLIVDIAVQALCSLLSLAYTWRGIGGQNPPKKRALTDF